MNRIVKRAAVAATAAAAVALVSAPAGGAAPAKAAPAVKYCAVQDGQFECATTEAGMKAQTGSTMATWTHVLTLFNGFNHTGERAKLFVDFPGDRTACTAESDFNDPEERVDIPPLFGDPTWASSVNKIAAAHCNWILVGPEWGRSTEVEGDWLDLRNLGDGWNNRAVRVLID